MKNKNFIIAGLATAGLLYTLAAHALSIDVSRRDMKLATQQLVEKQTISAPGLQDSDAILNDSAGDVGAGTVTVSSFLAQPDVPRNIVITPGGTTEDVDAGYVIVYGTDFFGAVIQEDFLFVENTTLAATGNLAFASVTAIKFPSEASPYGATWDVGFGEKLGLKRCMEAAGHLLFATLGGAYEATRPAVVAGSSIASNSADLSSAYDGASDVELFFFQNFECFP